MKKEVRSIAFRITMGGTGIVNFDEQSFKHKLALGIDSQKFKNDNSKFAKKVFTTNPEGKLEYKLKISNNCIRHNIFKQNTIALNPAMSHSKPLLLDYLGSRTGLLRGWMFTQNGGVGYKRKSTFSMSDLVQINNSKSHLEFFSRSGKKEVDSDKSDTTIFMKETVGYTEYRGMGFVDVAQLQFLSFDDQNDRMAVAYDDFALFKKLFQREKNFPNFNGGVKPYIVNDASGAFAEMGVLFTQDIQNDLVRHLFKNMYNLLIVNGGTASVNTVKLEYKPIYNAFNDTLKDEGSWIIINNESEIDELNFNFKTFYTEQDSEMVKKLSIEIEKAIAEEKDTKKKKKEAEAKIKKEKLESLKKGESDKNSDKNEK